MFKILNANNKAQLSFILRKQGNLSRKRNKTEKFSEKLFLNKNKQKKQEQKFDMIIIKIQYLLVMQKNQKSLDKELKVENNPQKEHKYTIKEYYRCFCQKIYTTYPSLYLHVKNKHSSKVSIQMKNKLKPKKQWSGNVKKVIYQFLENSAEDEEISQRSSRSKNKRNKFQIKEELVAPIKQEYIAPHRPWEELNKKKKKSTLITMGEENIRMILTKYQENINTKSSFQDLKYRENLIEEFIQFLNANYKEIDPSFECMNYCLESTAQNIPHLMNPFYFMLEKKGHQGKAIIKELSKLSKWLYEENYASYLAVKDESFEPQNYFVKEE